MFRCYIACRALSGCTCVGERARGPHTGKIQRERCELAKQRYRSSWVLCILSRGDGSRVKMSMSLYSAAAGLEKKKVHKEKHTDSVFLQHESSLTTCQHSCLKICLTLPFQACPCDMRRKDSVLSFAGVPFARTSLLSLYFPCVQFATFTRIALQVWFKAALARASGEDALARGLGLPGPRKAALAAWQPATASSARCAFAGTLERDTSLRERTFFDACLPRRTQILTSSSGG